MQDKLNEQACKAIGSVAKEDPITKLNEQACKAIGSVAKEDPIT